MSSNTGSSRSDDRLNAALTVLLLLISLVLANRIARDHLVVRRDLSEDQLYAVSDATRSILGGLEDRLQVTTYFTGEIEFGEVALLKARVEAQLEELAAIAGDRMEIVALDPSVSSEAASEVRRLRIYPQRVRSQRGTQLIEQEVYLGMTIRYRGRDQVLAQVDPWGFEVQFCSAVYALVRDRRARVGWYGPWKVDPARPGGASHELARRLVEGRHELLSDGELANLRYGQPVPDDVDILFVVAPREEHPRVAFELDQYVRRGGKLVVLVDQVRYDALTHERLGAAGLDAIPATGLEELLGAYGAPVTPEHVWDTLWAGEHAWLRARGGGVEALDLPPERVPVRTPLLIQLAPEGLDPAHPVTAGLSGVTLSWAQPIAPVDPPEGVVRTDLLRSSESSTRLMEPTLQHVLEEDVIQSKSAAMLASRRARSYPLAVALEGTLPPVFERAPAPDDPLLEDEPLTFTDEPVLSGGEAGQVVVFGDADWLRDDAALGTRFAELGRDLFPFFNVPGNQLLFMNLLDWLTLDEELIALRRRLPRERPLADFEAEARASLGLVEGDQPRTTEAYAERLELEERATAEARRRRWLRMMTPVTLTLALVAALGLAWNLSQRTRRGV